MRQFDKNDSTQTLIADLVEGQYYANKGSYGFSAGFLTSVLEEVIAQLPKSKREAMRLRLHYDRIDAWSKVS